MRLAQLRQRLADLGAKPCHQDRVLRAWCGNGALDNRRSRPRISAGGRARRPARILTEADGLARAVSEHPGGDGSARLLVALADGATVESVLLLREGLCVSTQVGCAVGCRFCMTGRDGLLRQLGSAEIVAQVALARRRRPLRRVVFMGMGEPAHNLDNVLRPSNSLAPSAASATRTWSSPPSATAASSTACRPGRSSRRWRCPSTRPGPTCAPHCSPRLPPSTPPNWSKRGNLCRATGYPIQYQWTLLAGVNDGDDEADAIVRLLRAATR